MSIVVGEVIAVSGVSISLRIFEDSSQETIFYKGVKYRGISIREHISIQRGFIDIVGLVEGEFLDERKLEEDTEEIQYIRRVEVRPIGYIMGGKFFNGVKYMPMIRDKAFLLSELIISKIYGYNSSGFSIGSMLKEDVRVNLPWTRLFNGHLGIFGNTGSGKSNTLTKLYTTLFNEKLPALRNKSHFVIIDFNGEYTENQILQSKDKQIVILDSRNGKGKFKIDANNFWDAELLSLLFKATQNTQKPFLERMVINKNKFKDSPLKNYLEIVFKKVFTSVANPNALVLIRKIAQIISCSELQDRLDVIKFHSKSNKFFTNGIYFELDGNQFENCIKPIINDVNLDNIDQFTELILRCYLNLCSYIIMGRFQYDHIQPMLSRAESSITSLRNILEIVNEPVLPHLLHVFSLKKCNNEIKKILPLLIARSFYIHHKESETQTSPPSKTLHFIIDEAHNILSEQSTREHELWKDYRLELFEEIIKEGRKYGVYLTISSQRPADISPTIVSQIHNFFIHRLVNDKDLLLLDNTISTLDSNSKKLIPTLAKGCCVVTGTAFDLPMILKVDSLEKEYRPSSDDVDLEKLWDEPKTSKSIDSETGLDFDDVDFGDLIAL